MIKKSYILIFFVLTFSCQSMKEAGQVLRNEKVTTTDEFLVKKRDPLVLPPDYKDLPEPGQADTRIERNEEEKIKKILKAPDTQKEQRNKDLSIEKSILDKIRK